MKTPKWKATVGSIVILFGLFLMTKYVSRPPDSAQGNTPVQTQVQDEQGAPEERQTPANSHDRVEGNIGFASHEKYVEHYHKHGREFGNISMSQYLQEAQALRDKPAGGDILEYVREDGVTSRFDKNTRAFIAFNPDRTIRTYFKPNDGEAYFHRQARREH